MPRIEYQHERIIDVDDRGQTLLEISLAHGIPHMHACGGQARCSTCRVMVLAHPENLGPRTAAEDSLARKKGFAPDIRLACQSRVTGPVCIRRLVRDAEDAEVVLADAAETTGRERKLAILFSDVRGFTSLSERLLAYDVVHILNRHFRKMGEAILHSGGYIDKYMGDGIMALFGLDEDDPALVCAGAVRAGLAMQAGVGEVNDYLRRYFDVELRIGVGIHYGEVVVGEVGHPHKMQLTAIGDPVNTASRIEAATKQADAGLLVSEDVLRHVAGRVRTGRQIHTTLRGKAGSHLLHEIVAMDADDRPVQALRLALRAVVTRDTAPVFLRLVFHDAVSLDPATGRGGANGSIRFPEELARASNRGLAPAVEALARARHAPGCPETSFADMIAVAGALAVEVCGGPRIEVPLGRRDADRPDADRTPGEHMGFTALLHVFQDMGLSRRDLTALSGAHTLGRAHGRPFTEDCFRFSNSYFVQLLAPREDLALLPSDRALLDDPACRELAAAYAMDEALFFRDFADAYVRMTLCGQARWEP